MIFGIGTDIVELSRVQGIYDRFGDHFARRILMVEEMALYERTRDPVRFLAMRFAGMFQRVCGERFRRRVRLVGPDAVNQVVSRNQRELWQSLSQIPQRPPCR